MADDWNAFPEVPAEHNDFASFPEVKEDRRSSRISSALSNIPSLAIPQGPIPLGEGEKHFVEDRALLDKSAGYVPEGVKAFLYPLANTALFEAPSHVVAAGTSLLEGKPYLETYRAQKEYEKALARQNQLASTVGTAGGLIGGLAVPLGPLGTLGKTAETAATAKFGETAGKAAGIGASGLTSGVLSGVSSGIESLDPMKAVKDAAIGTGIGAAASLVIPTLGRYFRNNPSPVDAAGNLTAEAERAIQSAFKGKMSPEDIDSFKSNLVDTFNKKGVSEAAAREALLAKEGVTPTKSLVTGEAPPASAANIGETAATRGQETLTETADRLAGAAPASPTAAAEILHAAERAERKAAQAQYGVAEKIPGQFAANAADEFLPSIDRKLSAKGIPTSFENAGSLFSETEKARKFIENGVAAGNLPNASKPFDMKNLGLVREQLNIHLSDAVGKDAKGVRQVIDGFDDAINNAVQKNLFTGNGRDAVDQLRKARSMWEDYRGKFYDNKGAGKAGNQFGQMMAEMVDQKARSMTNNLSQGSAEAANGILNASLLNKTTGLDMYERLQRALSNNPQAMDTVNQQIRSRVFNTSGDLSKLSLSIDKFLSENGSIAKKVFTGTGSNPSVSDLRRLSESIKIINAKKVPDQDKSSLILKALWRAGAAGASAIVGYHNASGVVAAATYLGSEALSGTANVLRTGFARSSERYGAPKVRPEAKPGIFVRNPEAWELPGEAVTGGPGQPEPYYQAPKPLTIRPGRKSGGRVSDRLIAEVSRAKKSIDSGTEKLLNVDDERIARALQVANQNLEG